MSINNRRVIIDIDLQTIENAGQSPILAQNLIQAFSGAVAELRKKDSTPVYDPNFGHIISVGLDAEAQEATTGNMRTIFRNTTIGIYNVDVNTVRIDGNSFEEPFRISPKTN